jgi:hypothetical protein
VIVRWSALGLALIAIACCAYTKLVAEQTTKDEAATIEQRMTEADTLFVEGVAAYDRAVAASVFKDKSETVKAELVTANDKLDHADAVYREILALDANRDAARRKLFEIRDVGKVCCNKDTLWAEYGIERYSTYRKSPDGKADPNKAGSK